MDFTITAPASPSDIPRLPRTNVELLPEATEILTLDEPWNLELGSIQTLRVKTGFFTVNVTLNTRHLADRLIVTFHGARGVGNVDAKNRKGLFVRHNWDTLYKMPILSISDPRCEDVWGSNTARISMYLGTFEHDLVPEINALVDKVCEELRIEASRSIFMGASSGGSAAILVGSRRKTSRILTVCAHLRSDKFRDSLVAAAAESAGGTMDEFDKVNDEEPWRFSPIVAMKRSLEQGNDMKVVVAQNLRDFSTLNRHFPRFCTRFDIPATGGMSPDGRLVALMYDHKESGHGFEPPEMSLPLWTRTVEFFDSSSHL